MDTGQYNPFHQKFSDPRGDLQARSGPPAQRPTGVTIIAVLNFLGSATGVAIFVLTLVSRSVSSSPDSALGSILASYYESRRETTLVASSILVVLSLTIGIGLWKMRRWAFLLALIVNGIASVLLVCVFLNRPLTLGTLLALMIPVSVVIYLLQPNVSRSFGE